MKIVKEHINEIKQNQPASGLSAIGIGKARIIQDWIEEKKKKYQISYWAEYINGYIRSKNITLNRAELNKMPLPPNIKYFNTINYIQCNDCHIDSNGDIVPKDRKDFIKSIVYDIKNNNIHSYKFVNHYLYYIALKFIQSFGDKGVHDEIVKNKIKLMAYPNTRVEDNGYWDRVYEARNHTPISEGTDRVSPRIYKINKIGLDYIEDHAILFEK